MKNPIYTAGLSLGGQAPRVKVIGRIRKLPGNHIPAEYLVEVVSNTPGYLKGERFTTMPGYLWDKVQFRKAHVGHVFIGKEWANKADELPWYHEIVDYKRRVHYEPEAPQ